MQFCEPISQYFDSRGLHVALTCHQVPTAQVIARRAATNPSADQVMDLIFGPWRSHILSAGTELGVFDRLDKERGKAARTLGRRVGR